MIRITKESEKEVKKFKCCSENCGCEFESDEYEDYGIVYHKCPKCQSSETINIYN